jgi:hypothetical protein
MVTSERKAELQGDVKSDGGERTRRYHDQRALDLAQLPENDFRQRFPAGFAAIALAEVFGIQNPVLLPPSIARR